MATVTTRLAINELRSARARGERYVGEWLREPITTDGRDDPARHAETADALSLAMLVLLESLSPEQRAALLLHDVFAYGYPEIAAIVGKSEDNMRQLATRARRHIRDRRPRFQPTREQRDELARRFFAAAEHGDLAGLEALLAHDVALMMRDYDRFASLSHRTLCGGSPPSAGHDLEVSSDEEPLAGNVTAGVLVQVAASLSGVRHRVSAGLLVGAARRHQAALL